MSAIYAGSKRSFQHMNGAKLDSLLSSSISQDSSPSESLKKHLEPFTGHISGFASNTRPRKASFETEASVVLIGVRGVGKSSLGVLAATAYNRHLIDTEQAFFQATGSTTAAYRKENGAPEYQKRHRQVLENTLEAHSRRCVIICSFSDLENDGMELLREYSRSHPIIHITRDANSIQSHLQVWSEERINELLDTSGPLLRSCSNYEFFNLSEILGSDTDLKSQIRVRPNEQPSSHASSFLTLKRAERDFVRLLRNIIGDHDRGLSHHSAYPLSQIPVEHRNYTFAGVVHAQDVITNRIDLEEAQIGVDCIELVISSKLQNPFRDAARSFAIVRRATILPILLTVEKFNDIALHLEMTEYCLRLGPEYCTLNLGLDDSQLANFINSKGRTKIIGSCKFIKCPPRGWENNWCMETFNRAAARVGCDIVKITMPPCCAERPYAIYSFRQSCESRTAWWPSLIAYETGAEGRPTKCFNKVLTPVVSKRSGSRTTIEDDSVTAKAITQALFANFVLEPMQFFIYGADVSYSLSPSMHNAAYEACGMPHTFEHLSSNTLDNFNRLVMVPGFGGAAVTLPFKTTVLRMVHGLSPHAKVIGAVNTVIPVRELTQDGQIPDERGLIAQRNKRGPVKALYGHNTDWIGIRACVRKGLSPANTVRPQSSGLVCGAGGMARSAVYALLSLGVRNVVVCNRTVENAQALADYYNRLIDTSGIPGLRRDNAANTRVCILESFTSSWPSEVRQPTMIICCIPTQTPDGSPIDFEIPEAWLKSPTGGVVVEIAYRRPNTPVSCQIRARAQNGWILMDGFDMLPEQAFSQFELFTGRRAPRAIMRSEVLKHYTNTERELTPRPG